MAAISDLFAVRRGHAVLLDDRAFEPERVAGRNQNLYDFWFYITNFSRYPMEIYEGPIGTPLRQIFTFLIPILVVVNVPARILAQPLVPELAAGRFCPVGHRGQPGRLAYGYSYVPLRAIAARVVERE